MVDLVHSINFCVEVLANQVPVALVYYSHLPIIVLSALFGFYILFYARQSTLSKYLFITLFLFAVWAVGDLVAWVMLDNSALTMFAWSLLELVEVSLFYAALNLTYHFLCGRSIPAWVNALLALPVLAMYWLTLSGTLLLDYNTIVCEATENTLYTEKLSTFIDLFYFIIIIGLYLYDLVKKGTEKVQKLIFMSGLFALLFFFVGFNYIAEYFENYNWSLFALAGMPVFLAMIGFSTVRYGLFNIKVIGAQILVFISIFMVASQFVFIQNTVNMYLNGFTLAALIIGGVLLIKSVRKVEAQRELLAQANAGQERFIHFLGHEVKGFLTVARNGFASIAEGDYGPVPEQLSTMAANALTRVNQGALTVESILKSANLKSGKVAFKFAPFDLCAAIRKRVDMAQQMLHERGLTLTANLPDGDYIIVGDQEHLTDHVLRNLIENSIYYTPAGSITLSLVRKQNSVLLSIRDTGVGISDEDKKHLFTEGGHGADSMKINAHSTGHGLFIAKNIVEAHGGRIWAESAGAGRGTTFYVELPVNPPAVQSKS